MFVLSRRRVGINAVTFSPGGATLAAACDRGLVQLWDVTAQRLVSEIQTGHTRTMYAAVAGDVIVTLQGKRAQLLDRRSGMPRGQVPRGSRRDVGAAAVDPGGKCVALGLGPALAVYRLKSGKVWEEGSARAVTALAYSADGRRLAAGLDSGATSVYEASSGHWLGTVTAGPGAVKAVALSPCGDRVAMCQGPTVSLHRPDSMEEVARQTVGRTHVHGVAFHPSGDFFATANGDGVVDYWDTATGKRRESFDWGVGKLNGVTFDAAGDRAACCSATGAVVIWDVDR